MNAGYDRNGNILGLKRSGKNSSSAYGMIDNLILTYDGNQLKNVTDAATDPLYNGVFNFVDESKGSGTEYIYDSNGNMQQDYNKKISKIQYNLLNLPATLQFTNGNRKDYTYSADGKKLKVVHRTAIANISVPMGQIKELAANQISQTHTVDYCGNVIYENGSLSKVLTEEGYATLGGTTPTFYYYLKDHQGNNRMVVRLNGTSWNTEQVNHYYPFGGVFEVNTGTSGKQSYKYNGKELDRMHGLDWYDYGWRMMDAALGRFSTMDRLSEKYYSVSPYAYCMSNPIRFVDIQGDSINVAEEYREQFTADMQNVFGGKATLLSFNSNGNLILQCKTRDFTKGMSKNQKNVFSGLKKAMEDKRITSVVYEDNYSLTIGEGTKATDIVKEFGGGVYSKIDNTIVIAPSVETINVTLDQMQVTNGNIGFPTQNVVQNTTSTLFHEIGERNISNINFRGGVIDYENYPRKIIGLPIRPFDLNHSKTIRTNYK